MVDVANGSTNSHTLTGLTNGQTYTISIATASMGIFGDSVQLGRTLLCKQDSYFEIHIIVINYFYLQFHLL